MRLGSVAKAARRTRWAFVILGLLVVALVAAGAVAEASPGSLHGRVFDAESGGFVPYARLRLASYGMTAEADDLGAYAFSGVPPGVTTLVVEAQGYHTHSQDIRIAGGDQTLDIVLRPVRSRYPARPADTGAVSTMVQRLLAEYGQEDGHVTAGIDLLLIGSLRRDRALGYPRSAVGANPAFGVTWRRYDLPSASEVRAAAEEVASRYGRHGVGSWEGFRSEVRTVLNREWFSYFGVNTVALVVPGLEFGWTYDTAGPEGGGVQVNASLVWGLWTALIPVPLLGLSVSF